LIANKYREGKDEKKDPVSREWKSTEIKYY